MKTPKLTNAELRARIMYKWKKKGFFMLKHLWCKITRKPCQNCKDAGSCVRYRAVPWIEWNFSALSLKQ